MRKLAQTAEAIAATTKKLEKVRITADYLKSVAPEEAAQAALFLSGRAFPAWEETILQVGGALLSRALLEVTGPTELELTAAFRCHVDLGAAAKEFLEVERTKPAGLELSLGDVAHAFRGI